MTNCAIAYYRVSTKRQGQSGLGLAAQQTDVERYAAQNGLTIAQSFTEVETGTSKRKRIEIEKAISAAKERGCKLLIAKIDRLARNVAFVSSLMESKVDFVAVDMPEANNLTIHIMAAMAEHEAKLISKRVKSGLDEKLARDGEWRSGRITEQARENSRKAISQNAKTAYQGELNYIRLMRGQGMSFGKIAKQLNADGKRTRTGAEYQAMTVKRILDRATK